MNRRTVLKDTLLYQDAFSKPARSDILIHNGVIEGIFQAGQSPDPGPGAEALSLANAVIIPGIYDAHLHLLKYALSLEYVDCDTTTIEECIQRIRLKTAGTEPGSWIIGHGWDHNRWGRYGHRTELDLVSKSHPVYLTSRSLHSAWVNSFALKLAGITSTSPNPPGGSFERDTTGAPSGILLEKAVQLVAEYIPAPDVDTAADLIARSQAGLWKFGLVGVHNFDRQLSFRALQTLRGRGLLGIRVLQGIPLEAFEQVIDTGIQEGLGDEWLKIGAVKVFMDGALGPHTAAMLEPYLNNADGRGFLLTEEEELLNILLKAQRSGLSLAIHAIGDLANRTALNAIERAAATKIGVSEKMHRLEHAQLLDPADLPRLAALHTAASMQPIHATSDMQMAELLWGSRCETAYAWRSLLDCKTNLLFGSDAPVESPDPFVGMHAAVTRLHADGSPGGMGWIPGQRISLPEALHAYTAVPASFHHSRMLSGTLQSGHAADLVALPQDPFRTEPANLKSIHPIGTMVGGEWRYRTF